MSDRSSGDNFHEPRAQRPHVIIIGGGFAGLNAAKVLAGSPVDVTVLDAKNHHLFQPLLYQVATAGLAAPDIAAPIREVLRGADNITVFMEHVTEIRADERCVVTQQRVLPYDYLIVATGATHDYFGNDDWAEHAPGLKTIEDALEIRERILLAYEAAEREPDDASRRPHLTFVVVGAGPTGVELAGALAEIAHHTLARDFARFDPSTARVLLIEGLDRVLPTYPEKLSLSAQRALEARGVEVMLETMVEDVDEDGVVAGGERIDANTVLWAAGVRASPLGAALGAPCDRVGRVEVNADLSVPDHPEVFVAGDLAALEIDGEEVPGLAPAAVQMGRHAAHNINRLRRGESTTRFVYRDKGTMATIGRAAAVAESGKLRLTGFIAWLAWLFVHILFLIGFRNRLAVLLNWGWAYLTLNRGARVVISRGRLPAGQAESNVPRDAAPRDMDGGADQPGDVTNSPGRPLAERDTAR